jgi:hypothetical protein
MRVLITGWPSFRNGEATAGDVLAMDRVAEALGGAGIACEQAFSPVFAPGARTLDDAPPERYSHVVFACGPAHGDQVRWLHERYAPCTRIAVGVSVVDPVDPAVRGFDTVLPRDGDGSAPDLCWAADGRGGDRPAVVGVVFAPGQPEYGDRGRHDRVHAVLGDWLNRLDCAPLPLDTRLDTSDWRHCATPAQFAALVARTDVVVTTRLHGLVFALRAGVPVVAVDPVRGGGKVTAQARSLGWPAVAGAERLAGGATAELDRWWAFCGSPQGRARAARPGREGPNALLGALLRSLAP